MANEEYSFSDKTKVINNLLIPFFQNMTVDTTAEEFLSLVRECILRLDVFKNPVFETLGLQFPYNIELIYPQLSQLIPKPSSNNKMTADLAMVVILNSAFSYFNIGGEFILIAAAAAPVVQQIFQIQNNDFFLDFYVKLTENEKINKLKKEDFEYLNGLIFYYIIKFLADCIFIQLTIPPGTPLIINANSSAPGILTSDFLLKQKILADLQLEIDIFYNEIV